MTTTVHMKHLYFLLCTFLCLTPLSKNQAQGYIRGGVGAGFATSQDAFGVPDVTRDAGNVVVSQRTIFGSFGQGIRASLAGGYMITPYFGVELELYYFHGFKQNYGSTTGGTQNQWNRTGYSYQMRAIPSLVVQAPTEKFQPYARFGVLVPFWGKTILEENWAYVNGNTREKQTDIDGKFSVGFEASMGVQYNINDNLGIYIQATYTALRIRSDKASTTKDNETDNAGNVTNRLETSRVIFKEIEFQDELTPESNTSSALSVIPDLPPDVNVYVNNPSLDLDKPLNLPTQTSNFNTLAFSVGVKYTFSNKK